MNSKHQSGMSLVSLLMSLSLTFIFIFILITMFNRIIYNRNQINLRKSKNDTLRIILQTMDCKPFNYSCSDYDLVNIRNFSGAVLVNNESNPLDLSKYEKWSVRAVCQGKSPQLEFALLNPITGGFLKDTMTEELINWSNNIAVPSGILCRSEPTAQMIVGPRCDREARRTASPSGSLGPLTGTPLPFAWFHPPGNICNPNGSDGTIPPCPGGTSEWYRYWDRDARWGKSGSWVVACW